MVKPEITINPDDLKRLRKKLTIKWFNIILSHCLDDASKTAKELVEDNIYRGMEKGIGWPPFAEATIRYKTKHARPLTGLVDTGKMHKSVLKRHTTKDATITVNTPYATYHEHGTEHIPARSFLGMVAKKKDQRNEVVKSFKKKLDKELNQKWPK